MLYEGDVPFKKVIDHFSDGNYDGKSNTHVTLNKYLNAMKIFGIKVKKTNNKFRMLNALYKLQFDLDDIKCIKLLKKTETILPENQTKTNFETFLNALELRLTENSKSLTQIDDISDDENRNLDFSNAELTKQIEQCNKLCQDKLKTEIVFINEDGEEINLLCSPQEPIYQKKKLYLKAVGNNGSRIYNIPLENVKSIKQLPIASKEQSIPTTVVYRIKDRLAKNYRLRDWERLDKIEADGSKIIVNKNEDLNQLLRRLMRYGIYCNVISPKFLKEEMIERINKTIANYK